jgi:hypothetical protein
MINKERSFEETKFEYHIKSGEGKEKFQLPTTNERLEYHIKRGEGKEKFQLPTTNERLEWEEEDRIGGWRRKDH